MSNQTDFDLEQAVQDAEGVASTIDVLLEEIVHAGDALRAEQLAVAAGIVNADLRRRLDAITRAVLGLPRQTPDKAA